MGGVMHAAGVIAEEKYARSGILLNAADMKKINSTLMYPIFEFDWRWSQSP